LALFSTKSMLKNAEGKGLKKAIETYTKGLQSRRERKKAILKSSLQQIHNRAEGTFYGARTNRVNSRAGTAKISR